MQATGTLAASATPVSAPISNGAIVVVIAGTYTGATVYFEASPDNGTTWVGIMGRPMDGVRAPEASNALASNGSYVWFFDLPIEAFTNFRVRAGSNMSGCNVWISPLLSGHAYAPPYTSFSGSGGAQSFSGATTFSALMTIGAGLVASGSVSNDFSAGTGTFKTSTGANTLGGATTIADATTPSLETANGKTNTGFLGVKGKTSGELKITCADALAQTVTVTAAAQTVGAATLTIPNFANVNDTFAFVTLAQTLASKTLTSPVIATGLTASGAAANDFSGSTGTFKTSTGLHTFGGKAAFKVIATPVAATGAGGGAGGAAALGSAQIVVISSDGATKGVILQTGVAGDVVFVINSSSTAANLFPATGGTLNGLSANTGVAIPASKGSICICTAADTWIVFDLTAHAGAAA